MKFLLNRDVIGNKVEVELTEEQFNEIVEARRVTLECLYLEQLFEMLLESFLDVEELLLLAPLRQAHCFTHDASWGSGVNDIQRFAHVISNYLAIGGSYRDRSKKFASSMRHAGDLQTPLEEEFSLEFDNTFGFMVSEMLRNHTLHAGTCVHRLNRQLTRVLARDGRALNQHVFTPQISLDLLEENKENRKKTLAKMRTSTQGEKVGKEVYFALPPILREYMDGLGRVHLWIRARIRDVAARADDVILERVTEFENLDDSIGSSGLQVVKTDDEGFLYLDQPHQVLREPIDHRRKLILKNANPQGFSRLMCANQSSAPLTHEEEIRRMANS